MPWLIPQTGYGLDLSCLHQSWALCLVHPVEACCPACGSMSLFLQVTRILLMNVTVGQFASISRISLEQAVSKFGKVVISRIRLRTLDLLLGQQGKYTKSVCRCHDELWSLPPIDGQIDKCSELKSSNHVHSFWMAIRTEVHILNTYSNTIMLLTRLTRVSCLLWSNCEVQSKVRHDWDNKDTEVCSIQKSPALQALGNVKVGQSKQEHRRKSDGARALLA